MTATAVRNPATGRFVKKAVANPEPDTSVQDAVNAIDAELEASAAPAVEAPEPRVDINRVPWATGNMVAVNGNNGATVAQIMREAGLDWEVEFGDLKREERVTYQRQMLLQEPYVDARPTLVEIDDPAVIKQIQETDPDSLVFEREWRVAKDVRDVRRKDNLVVLGQVGREYEIIQNWEAFRFADSLVDDGTAKWIAAGDMYDGSHVYGVMELNETVLIGGEDPVGCQILFRTSHNGSTGVQVMVIPMRFTCDNMMTVASKSAKFRWSLRHVNTLQGRLQNARDTLKLTVKYMEDGFAKDMDKLLTVSMTDEKAGHILDRVIPENRAKRDEIISGIMAAYHDSDINGYEGKAYGLLNGLTDYYDHIIPRRTADARFTAQVGGEGHKMRNELTQALLELAA